MDINFDEDYEGGGFDNEVHWDEPETVMDGGPPGGPPPLFYRNPRRKNARNNRYDEAYGNYRGGYGPGGGFGPPHRHFNPGPPPLLGWTPMRGNPFAGPPRRRGFMDDRTIRYLMRCSVPKENLKNLPRSLLSLIEPNHCGLCDMNFESFAVSRMHYISKNHLKKQKKWISQNHEGGYLQHLETPLKARDLYCELCDVHITSKVHAESHYAGKPHRSVVDGRKNPKNPILLQRGMEQRLEQLIRREKKFIKIADEEVPKDDAEPAKDKPKPSPELYCDICKTTMTCSEQMTMHLNGKKHLTKEKQHILKMMKGNAPGNSAASNADPTEEPEIMEEDASEKVADNGEKPQAEGGQEDFDWPADGGKWEGDQ